MKTKTPPRHLSASARAWWKKLTADYEIGDAAGELLLTTALEAFDRLQEARKAINRDGAVVKDRFGQLRSHPAVTVERDARSGMVTALRALRLEVALEAEPVRPR